MIEPGFLFYFLFSNQTVKDECGQESVTGFFPSNKKRNGNWTSKPVKV